MGIVCVKSNLIKTSMPVSPGTVSAVACLLKPVHGFSLHAVALYVHLGSTHASLEFPGLRRWHLWKYRAEATASNQLVAAFSSLGRKIYW